MPTFLLLLGVLVVRVGLALARGALHLIMLPARTALAIAPHTARPRWLLISGAAASLALAGIAALMLGRAR